MRLARMLLLALLVAAPLRADFANQGLPSAAADSACVSGQFWLMYNTSTGKVRKCQNGVITDSGTSVYTGTSAGVSGNQYDPERAGGGTLVSACSDEFDGTSTGTWVWQNQGTATFSTPSGADYGLLSISGVTASHARTCTLDNSVPWTMTIKLSVFSSTGGTTNGGLIFPEGACNTGQQAEFMLLGNTNTPSYQLGRGQTLSGFTATPGMQPTPENTLTGMVNTSSARDVCLQVRYVPATKVMTMRASSDCRNWAIAGNTGTWTFLANPVCGGFFLSASSTTISAQMVVQWIRTRQDAAGTSGEFSVGQ